MLSDAQFRVPMSLRMFGVLCPAGSKCSNATSSGTPCGCALDLQGRNLISNADGGGLVRRHDAVRSVLAGLLCDARYCGVCCEQILATADGDVVGRSDITWTASDMKQLHGDVAVVLPTTRTAFCAGASTRPGCAASKMGSAKLNKYRHVNARLAPMVLESGGRQGLSLLRFITGPFRAHGAPARVHQTVSCAFQRSIASAILSGLRILAGGK